MRLRSIGLCAAAAISVAGPALAASYTSTPIVAPNAGYTWAYGINDHGMMAGTFRLNGGGGTWHGFTYNVATKTYTTYDTIPSCPFQCSGVAMTAINNLGAIAGYTADNGYGDFIFSHGKFKIYVPPGYKNYYVLSFGLNIAGTVVGYYTDGNSFVAGYSYTKAKKFSSFLYGGSYNTSIQAINDAGLMVGYYQSVSQHGFIYDGTHATQLDFPGATNTVALGINNAGVVVGDYGYSTGPRHAFMYAKGIYTAIPDQAAGVDNIAWGINRAGVILIEGATGISYMLTPTRK